MTNNKTKQTRPVDWNRFVQQPDPEVKAQYDASTEKQMHRIKKSFIEYVDLDSCSHWLM